MLTDLHDPEAGDETLDDDLGPRGAGAVTAPQDDGDAGGATLVDVPQASAVVDDPRLGDEPIVQDHDYSWLDDTAPSASEAGENPTQAPPSAIWPRVQLAPQDVDTAQLFRDRPDVFQGFFTAFYGPNNDHHSNAWNDRVGGETPEAYALYWYKTYGVNEGYVATALARPAASPLEPEVRTTADGIPLDQILHDRPDVFQGFFTEFYGPNNDHHSSAWNDRVGGSTPQDYANYWYETYGKADGYGATPVEESDTADGLDRELASPFGAPAGEGAFFLLT